MNSKAPVALAIGVGYVLGRTHKLRLALLLGAAAATGQLGGLSTRALESGAQLLRSNPDLAKMTDSAGRLLEVGRNAAMVAVNSKVASMEGALEDKMRLSEPDAVRKVGSRLTGHRDDVDQRDETGDRDEPDADYDDAEPEDEYDEYDETDQDVDDEAEDDDRDEEDEEVEPRPPAKAGVGRKQADRQRTDAAGTTPRRSPAVRRTRG